MADGGQAGERSGGRGNVRVDVVAMSRAARVRDKAGGVTPLGEVKATRRPRTGADVCRPEHIRDLLGAQAWGADGCVLALSSMSEPAPDLVREAEDGRALLVATRGLYGSG